MNGISYRKLKHYKYQLLGDFSFQTDIKDKGKFASKTGCQCCEHGMCTCACTSLPKAVPARVRSRKFKSSPHPDLRSAFDNRKSGTSRIYFPSSKLNTKN